MRALAWVAISVLCLSACATGAQQQAARINEAVQVTKADLIAARDRAAALPSYQALKDKIPPLDGSSPSMALQTDTSKPNAEDVAALLEFHRDGLSPWRAVVLQDFAKVHPAYAAVAAETYVAADQQYARLVRREISWGDYATSSAQRTTAMRAALLRVDQQIKTELTNAHAYEIQQRQAAAAALSNWAYQQQVLLQNQQAINAANRPRMTNCQYVGTYLNCTTF
jgi:hypothetical protein